MFFLIGAKNIHTHPFNGGGGNENETKIYEEANCNRGIPN